MEIVAQLATRRASRNEICYSIIAVRIEKFSPEIRQRK